MQGDTLNEQWRICVYGEMINCLSAEQEVNQMRAVALIQIAEKGICHVILRQKAILTIS